MGPRGPQKGPEMALRWPKMRPRRRRKAQDKRFLRHLKIKTEKLKKTQPSHTFVLFLWLQECHDRLKLAPRGTQDRLRWAQGSNLTSSLAM